MDRDDEARQGDTGMIGSEAEEPGPGRDTSLTDPDPVAAGTDQPRGTVAMSEEDPMRTRLGSQIEDAGVIGFDVATAEEGATQETPPEDRPGYEPERPVGDVPATTAPVAATTPLPDARDPDLAAEPVVDRESYDDVGRADSATFADEPAAAEGGAFAADDAGSPDRAAVADDPARLGVGDAMADPARSTDDEAEPSVYDQEADEVRRQRPAGL
jgi:hypothetical protein